MSLTDIMSEAGLVGYAEVGLVISFVVFVGVLLWTLRRPAEEMRARARAVFEGEDSPPAVDHAPPAIATSQKQRKTSQ